MSDGKHLTDNLWQYTPSERSDESPTGALCDAIEKGGWRHMRLRGASLVVGADRYRLVDGKVTHAFEDDVNQDAAKLAMLKASLAAFKITGG